MVHVEIHRDTPPGLETSVEIRQGANRWRIDPQQEVKRACDVRISPQGRVVSFADGLRDSGLEVWICYVHPHWGRRVGVYRHVANANPTVLLYHLVGYAWGRGQWGSMVASLRRTIMPEKRFQVLEATAVYYFNHRYDSALRLQIPLNV